VIVAGAVLKAIFPKFDPKSRKTGGPDEGFNATPRKKVVRDDGGEPVVLGLALKEVPWRPGLLLAIVKTGIISEDANPEKLSAEDEKSSEIFLALLGIQSPGSVALLDRMDLGKYERDGGFGDVAGIVGFDFASYKLTETERGFGVRVEWFSSGVGAASSTETLTILILDETSLEQVFSMEAKEDRTDTLVGDEVKTSDTEIRRTLTVLPSKTEGYFDWKVQETMKLSSDEKPKATIKRSSVIYKWNGYEYAEAGKQRSAPSGVLRKKKE
jgi:hypothetical protein